MAHRELVLLGAGASVDAGLPTSRTLPEKVSQELPTLISSRELAGVAQQAFDFVFEELKRSNALKSPVDIEELVSAIDAIAERHSAPLAPFIDRWHPRLEELVGQVRESCSAGASVESLFREVGEAIRKALTTILWLPEEGKSQADYLAPLVRWAAASQVAVVTLNYDNTVESAAASAGIHCTTGIPEWQRDRRFPRQVAKGTLFLIKLHGSLNWARTVPEGVGMAETSAPDTSVSGILFAQTNKLSAEPPFFDMMSRFTELLNDCDRCTVLGYSFRDEHVNEVILRWFLKVNAAILRVATPSVEENPTAHPFLGKLPRRPPDLKRLRTGRLSTRDAVEAFWGRQPVPDDWGQYY